MRHFQAFFGVAVLLVLALPGAQRTAAGGNIITTVDTTGQHTSLVLDDNDNPVVAYYDQAVGDLRILHCGNPTCTSGNSIKLPDTGGNVGQHTSVVLDADGNPVVSYFDFTNFTLKLMHCNDPNCDPAVNGIESIISPDAEFGNEGEDTSLKLDGSGHPVVSHYGYGATLKLLHCNDPNCEAADESITHPDSGNVLGYTSLELDSSGNPVISYRASGEGLKLVHCGNPDCDPGNVINPVVSDADPWYTSLELDATGYPVISYREYGQGLRIARCNDPNCSANDESVTAPDSDNSFNAGIYNSLALDGGGKPVVSYKGQSGLKVMHCNDPNCLLGGDTIANPDAGGDYTSLALDSSGNPVVSYISGGNLKILVCGDPWCGETPPACDTGAAAEDCDIDGVQNAEDNCPLDSNPSQDDIDGDMAGDVCDSPGSGNVDCASPPNGVSAIDALKLLRHNAGLPVVQDEPCLDIGEPRQLPAPDNWMMGDVDCDGNVNAIDALKILRANAGLSVTYVGEGCPPIKPPG
jgi:hypothetical protein